MQRRMLFSLLSLVLILLSIIYLLLAAFGVFSTVQDNMYNTLDAALDAYAAGLTETADKTAAQSIKLSGKVAGTIEKDLAEQQLSFADLSGNREAIVTLENALYDNIADAIQMTDCSGAFLLLNTTVSVPDSGSSNSGIYLKVVNYRVSTPVTPELQLFRGCTEAADTGGIDCSSQWAMEFGSGDLPEALPRAGQDQVFLLTAAESGPDCRGNLYIASPIRDQDGNLLGVCGFEISPMYFKLSHQVSSGDELVFGVLAQETDGALAIGTGLVSGNATGYYHSFADSTLQRDPLGPMYRYSGAQESFAGLEKTVSLFSGSGDWTVAVMSPYPAYQEAETAQNVVLISCGVLVLALALALSWLISRRYVRPILNSIEKAKQGGNGLPVKTNIPEIDDLMDFLSAQDTGPAGRAPAADAKANPYVFSEEKYARFTKKILTLSPAERAVFDLYIEGLHAPEIAKKLFLSINTIKAHNKQIYRKLGVTSRRELLFYIDQMRSRGSLS